MILLESKATWRCPPLEFQPGTWLVEAATAASALHCNAEIKVASIKNPRPFDPAADYNDRSILIARSGGFGDLLFLTPLIRAIRKRWPRTSITVATTDYYREALADHPLIDRIIAYPLPSRLPMEFAAMLWFEGVIEWSPEAKAMHSVDLHAHVAGMELTQGHDLDYYAHERHLESMRARFPRPKGPRLGVQLTASAKCRTYPPPLMGELLQKLADAMAARDGQIVLFDAPKPHQSGAGFDPVFLSLPTEKPPLSFAQSAAVLHDCDAVIAPDSALCHVAGAMGLPTVALYGPFPSDLRTRYAPTITALDGQAPCSPCFWHDRESIWPAEGPCAKSGRCEALASLKPARIASLILKLLK